MDLVSLTDFKTLIVTFNISSNIFEETTKQPYAVMNDQGR